MDVSRANRVRQRAAWRCESCLLPQVASRVPFEIDHIRPRKHNGRDLDSNLALSCIYWKSQTSCLHCHVLLTLLCVDSVSPFRA